MTNSMESKVNREYNMGILRKSEREGEKQWQHLDKEKSEKININIY